MRTILFNFNIELLRKEINGFNQFRIVMKRCDESEDLYKLQKMNNDWSWEDVTKEMKLKELDDFLIKSFKQVNGGWEVLF